MISRVKKYIEKENFSFPLSFRKNRVKTYRDERYGKISDRSYWNY